MLIAVKTLLFLTGGFAYVLMELLFRGRSHYSMFLAGGACLLLVGQLNRVKPKLPPLFRALAGAGIITAVELLTGLLANRDYRVWDYREVPWNYQGQICAGFSLLWIVAAALVLLIHDPLETAIRRRITPSAHTDG